MSNRLYSTKEEWLKEYRKQKNMTPEERSGEITRIITEAKKRQKEYEQNNSSHVKPNGDEWIYIHADNPNSLDNGEATVSWIIIMIVGAIFNARWLIWIVATVIYLNYIFRYQIRKAKWDNGGKEEYYKKIENAFKGDK